jgi:hypothetical protein
MRPVEGIHGESEWPVLPPNARRRRCRSPTEVVFVESPGMVASVQELKLGAGLVESHVIAVGVGP